MASVTNPGLKSISLAPGECFVLPKDAVVQSIITDGAITVTSNCGTLPTPTSYKCGVFYFFTDITAGDDDAAMEEEHVQYTSVRIGNGTTFMINENVMLSTVLEPGVITPVTTLNLHITDTALFEFTEIARTALGDRQRVAVYFKVPEQFFDETTLKLSDRGTYYLLEANEAECDSYPEPE